MYNISLLCTVHREHGKCNSEELHNIIAGINPEIIFEEIHPNRFDAYYKNQSLRSLETKTIMQYLQNHQIEHIPVDTYDLPDIYQLFKDVDYMFETIFNNSDEYCFLCKERELSLSKYGFNYLNSNSCDKFTERLAVLEENVISALNDKKLAYIYNTWKDCNNRREVEIIKNIYNYSNVHKYNNAILFIGAEHKKAIIDIIQDYERENELKLNWNYNIYENL